MYLFVRSHLSWEDGELRRPAPNSAVTSLAKKQLACGLWPNGFDRAAPQDAPVSLRGSAFAITALGDWHQSQNAAGVTNDLSSKIGQMCVTGLEKLSERQTEDGAWPEHEGAADGDLWTTSQVYYAINRFADYFEVQNITYRTDRAEKWLLSAVATRIRNNQPIAQQTWERTMQEVAVALTALARQTGVGATIWLRQAIRWLFYACEEANKLSDSRSSISLADVWLLYSVIEIIRRESCATLLASERVI
jgi:hypothetical protein